MADPISITSRSVQDECERLLNEWTVDVSKGQILERHALDRHYDNWIQSHPVYLSELGPQTTIFKKMLDDYENFKDDKVIMWRSSYENSLLPLIDDLWEVVTDCSHSGKPLSDVLVGYFLRLDAHVDSCGRRTAEHAAPQFSSLFSNSYDEATLSIELPKKMTGRLASLARVWAIATLKVFLIPNLVAQLSEKEKKSKKTLLDRLRYGKTGLSDQQLLQAMHIAPDVLSSGRCMCLRDIIYSEGNGIVFNLALLISSVPHSFIVHLQILRVLPPPQPVIAQSLSDLLQGMISKSSTIRAQRTGDPHLLFIEWLNKVFARGTLHNFVEKVRLLVESCWTSELHKQLQVLSAQSKEMISEGVGTEYYQVLLLLRLQNSFLAFRKLMSPMPGSASVIKALDDVCSSLQLLTDFHIFSSSAHNRLKNRNRVQESVSLSDSLHDFSLPSIYPFYFENLRLPGSALPIPILISHEAVVSIGNSEIVFFSESVRVEDQALVLKPILISPCASTSPSSTRPPEYCTFIESHVKRLPSDSCKIVINWGTVMPENDPFTKAQKFNCWFIAVQCARVALWNYENRLDSGELAAGDIKALPPIACAFRWFPKAALHSLASIVCLCTQVIECIKDNGADVLRARGFNLSNVSSLAAPVLSACIANIIAGSANQLHRFHHIGSLSCLSTRQSGRAQLHIQRPSQLQDYVSLHCRNCNSLMQSSIDQIQRILSLSSVSTVSFQRHSLLLQGITADDLQAFDLSDLESNETEVEKMDVVLRVCAADNMFLRLFDVFDHHAALAQVSLLRLPGAGGIPFLNFPELRLRRTSERVHLSTLAKALSKQLNQPGPLHQKLIASYGRIQAAGLISTVKESIIDHLLKPRSDMGGHCIVGKLDSGVPSEQRVSVANSIWEKICSPQYARLLEQLLLAAYPIEFGIRLRLLVEPLCTILQASSKKEFGADDIIPLTEFVFYFVFAPRAMKTFDAYLYWLAKLCTFKEMLNDELAQSYQQEASNLISAHTKNNCPLQNWQGDIPAIKSFIRQTISEAKVSASASPDLHSPFQLSSSDDDVLSDTEIGAMTAPTDSLSASQLADLAQGPRVRGTILLEADSSDSNPQFTELTRSCIKRNNLLQTLHQANVVKNHSSLYKVIENCLRASEAIDMMVHINVCDSRADAIRIGKLMVADGLISPVDHNNPFADKPLLFRCVRPVLFESSLTITRGFFVHQRYFALYAPTTKSSNCFTLCWFKDKQKSEVRGEICVFPNSIIAPANDVDFELSLVQETKKGYGMITEGRSFKVRCDTKQLRDRWLDELTQAQKRLSAAPQRHNHNASAVEESRPSFFQDSTYRDSQRDFPLPIIEELPAASSGVGSDVLSCSSPLLSAQETAVIELDHVFYRGAHLSFNDFLLTASSESEWYDHAMLQQPNRRILQSKSRSQALPQQLLRSSALSPLQVPHPVLFAVVRQMGLTLHAMYPLDG